MSQLSAMQNAVIGCAGVLRTLPYFPADEVAFASVMRLLEALAQRPVDLERFATVVQRQCRQWPGPVELRALWCREIGMPADGEWADSVERVGEQIEAPFAGCPKCERGWRHQLVTRGGHTYSAVVKCECLRAAAIASGAPVVALEDGRGRAGSRNALQRADVRAFLEGKR